jgi:uncharacterized protein (DUF4415 family)
MSEKEKSITQDWVDPDDAPEWTEEVFDRAQFSQGGKVVRAATGTLTKRGRPKLEAPKRQVSVRLDQNVIEKLQEAGPGWQTRMNEILKKAVGV